MPGLRRLNLGSVSSLSFEEEENGDLLGETWRPKTPREQDGRGGGHELHDMLTTRLQEQVEYLLSASFEANSSPAPLGLRVALDDAVHAILRLSESEPYGVRGATILVRLRRWQNRKKDTTDSSEQLDDGEPVGAIAVDVNMVSTFNLILVLEEERPLSVAIKNWLKQFAGAKVDHMISPRFSLKKETLYRSSSGITLASFQTTDQSF